MNSNNPHSVAYLFRDYARTIHQKAVPADPNYLRICVACGKVCSYLPSISCPTCPFLTQCTDPRRRVDRTMGRTPLPFFRQTHRYRRHPRPLRSTKPNRPARGCARIREAQTRRHRRRGKWQCGRGDSPTAQAARRPAHETVAAVRGHRWRPGHRPWWDRSDCAWRTSVP